MLLEVKVPQLAESVAEATVATWHYQEGQSVRRGDILCDLETDKVTLEVAAPEDGVVHSLAVPVGATVLREALLVTIDTQGVATEAAAPAALAPHAETAPATEALQPPLPTGTSPSVVTTAPPLSGPATRKLASESGIDLAQVPQSQSGRVTKGDVLQFLADDEPAPAALALAPTAAVVASTASRQTERVPMTRLRKRAAERLLAAQQGSALLSTFNECNLQAVGALRERYREAFEKRHGVRLGYMSFFVRAVVEGLKRYPIINASVDGDDILYHDFFDIGIAVAAPRGLVVPVLRDADHLALAGIESAIRDFGDRARENRLTVEELSGGTFTITNGGVFGSLLSTPIVNPPQSAILGMHKIEQRPVVEDGQIVIRPMMYVAVSYDHRIIDGRDAVSFLVAVKEYLEQPERLLLDL